LRNRTVRSDWPSHLLGRCNIGIYWRPNLDGQVSSYQISRTFFTTLIHSKTKNVGVNFVEWSPDGSRFASASDDSTARVGMLAHGNRSIRCSMRHLRFERSELVAGWEDHRI
jgi:WD40 repeat protein